ncbi:sulfatase-like hydrolase/transferase [Maribacter chungangensis]|uniref:Sulfatase-like hydrolase/transferase n=1 Tax=Maribacter chungangensis TaxID=1069117 RepID=A0ABW3B396_9FLAO
MQVETNSIVKKERTLKDYIPLVITFFVGLLLLSIYQNTVLYITGVLDSVVNKSLFLHILHHLGFAAVCSVVFAFLFNLLENKKPSLGFNTVRLIFALLLFIEGLLITYFIDNYELLDVYGLFGETEGYVRFGLLKALMAIAIILLACHFLYRYTAPFYKVISRMYPFTIILFSMFLAILYSDRKPINENKTQHLLESVYAAIFEEDTYNGSEEYPLARAYVPTTDLQAYFDLAEKKPNIKILIIDGLGTDFVDAQGIYSGIMPYLQKMALSSLYLPNFISNTGDGSGAVATVVGSLPYGKHGFTNLDGFTHRHTLYSILKENGYQTAFNYGGNSALNSYDRFLVQEGVDRILDKTVFGKEYTLQNQDAAGITLGYPDHELFQRYFETYEFSNEIPSLEVFKTLSTKAPYAIPYFEKYEGEIEKLLKRSSFNEKTARFINHNRKLFASYSYTDEAIAQFFKAERRYKGYDNTIYIITGSHLNSNIPSENQLKRYQVPLLIYSPLLKSPTEISKLASHADIAPAILSLLDNRYGFKAPHTVAWLANGQLTKNAADLDKEIPLFRGPNKIQDYVYNSFFLSDGNISELNNDLSFSDNHIADEQVAAIKSSFSYNKSVNNYVTQNDKLLPKEVSTVLSDERKFSKSETLWLQSVFNGKDFDDAYTTARKLAFNKDWDRALLLSDYILTEIPRHADTEILKGRIYSWKKEYGKSIATLKEVIRKYPEYIDGYCALLDTYYWANPEQDIRQVLYQITAHGLNDDILNKKIQRANEQKPMLENSTAKLDMP